MLERGQIGSFEDINIRLMRGGYSTLDDVKEAVSTLESEASKIEIQYLKAKQIMESGVYDENDYIYQQAEKWADEYHRIYQQYEDYINEVKQNIGTYNYDKAIQDSINQYDGLENKLIELQSEGQITKGIIEAIFANPSDNGYGLSEYLTEDVIESLKKANVEAGQFYAWIMNISDPLRGKKNKVLSLIKGNKGQSGSFDDSYIEQMFKSAGIDLEDQKTQEIALNIYTKFGDDEVGYWSSNDWLKHIQAELNQKEVDIKAKVTLKSLMKQSTGTDEEGKDKTFGDDIDKYASKINTIEEYLDKLRDGTYTKLDLIEIGKEFGIADKNLNIVQAKLEALATSELQDIIDEIEEMKQGIDDPEVIQQLDEITNSCEALRNQAVETDNALEQIGEVKSDIWGSKSGIDKLSAIYKDIKDGADFDWSSIVNNNEFREEFSRFETEYNDFINGVFAHPKNIEANKKAFDDLADAYLKNEHILDGLNEAEKLNAKRLLDSMGVTNSAEMIEAEFASQRIQRTIDQANATAQARIEDAKKLKSEQARVAYIEYALKMEKEEIAQLQNLSEAQKAYYLEKQLDKLENGDFTSEDIEQLDLIIDELGLGGEAWTKYYKLRADLANAESMLTSGKIDKNTFDDIAGRINFEMQSALESYHLDISKIAESYKIDLDDAGTEAADAYLDAFNKELGELQSLRDAGVIDEKDYLMRLQQLYIKYFANKKKYYEEFKKYEKEYLEGLKALYESAISASITLLNDQKEAIEKEKDETIKTIEEQRDAETKAIQEQIDGLNDEKDALEKANEERERALNLQKAQYELERAHSQRTRLIYKNGQMQYVNDSAEIREAKNNVDDLLREKAVSEIDDKIDDLNKQLEEVEEHYSKLIEETEKMFDEQIEGVQKLIDMWEKLQHQAELVDAYTALNNFGISAQDILSGNLDAFNLIKDGYTGIFAGLSQDIDAVAQAFGTTAENATALKNAVLGYDDATLAFSNMEVNLKGVGYAAEEAARKIGDDNDFSSTKGAINSLEASAGTQLANVSSSFDTLQQSIKACSEEITNLSASIDGLNGTNIKFGSSKLAYTGTAYANGNWTAGSKGIVGKSLVGELGAEIRVRDGKFEVLGSNGAEFADIRKNDIIFNHKQSEELLKNGHINSRGKAFASGNANKFTALSPEELSKYNKLDFTKDLAEKLDFGNQKLMNIDKMVSNISTTKTVNSNPVFNIDNTFTCNGVSLADIQNELAKSFQGIFEAAYQKAMTK